MARNLLLAIQKFLLNVMFMVLHLMCIKYPFWQTEVTKEFKTWQKCYGLIKVNFSRYVGSWETNTVWTLCLRLVWDSYLQSPSVFLLIFCLVEKFAKWGLGLIKIKFCLFILNITPILENKRIALFLNNPNPNIVKQKLANRII